MAVNYMPICHSTIICFDFHITNNINSLKKVITKMKFKRRLQKQSKVDIVLAATAGAPLPR